MKGEVSQTFSSTTNSSEGDINNKKSKGNGLKKLGVEDKHCCVFDEDDKMNPRKPF
jgi:hypothetical protein